MSSLERLGILVVDDDLDMLKLCKLMLTYMFPEATTHLASSGNEALARIPLLITSHDPLIIFSDVQMPNGSGPELLRAVRSSREPRENQIPIILNTAMGGSSSEIRSRIVREAGQNTFELLEKPFTAPLLKQTMLRILAQNSAVE